MLDATRRVAQPGHRCLHRHRPQVGVPVPQLEQIGAQQWDPVVHRIDPVGDRGRRIEAVGDDLGHRALRVAEVLGPGQHVVAHVALPGGFLFVNPEVANAR